MDEFAKKYRVNFLSRPGFRYATSDLKVSEDKKFFYSVFTVTTTGLSHVILTNYFG